jgi:hypothetical protein
VISTVGTSKNKQVTVATQPYPFVGSSQHLCLVRNPKGRRTPNQALMLEWQSLPDTVLASAFCDRRMAVPTPLPAPYNVLELPDLRRSDLREQMVVDGNADKLGWMLQIPGLYVHANQVLSNTLSGNDRYNYEFAIARMASEAAHQMCSVLRSGMLRVREKPGLMAHAQDIADVPADCVGISEGFAKRILKQVQKQLPEITDVWQLDGFPVYAIRFPLANQWGIQELTLKILPGQGKYVAFNPWNLGLRYLGDSDGDLGFVLLRIKEVVEGALSIRHTPRIVPDRDVTNVRSSLSLASIRDPQLLGLDEKTMGKIDARFDTLELRLKAIEDADTRGHVAVYTMAIGWWIGRVLAQSGIHSPREAHMRSYDALEWPMENCMDARKGGSDITQASFNPYEFMRILLFGNADLPVAQLKSIGIPDETLMTLELAWALSDRNLRAYCAKSPIYSTFVLNRNSMEDSTEALLRTLKQFGVQASDVYRSILADLTCAAPFIPENPPVIPESSGDAAVQELAPVTRRKQWIANR